MSQQHQATTQEPPSESMHTGHPTPLTYVTVAMTLALITGVEVAIFYVTWLGYGIIPILVLLSGVKFALVVMFYMHLRYDARLFSGFFIGGLGLALLVVVALMGLFRLFS